MKNLLSGIMILGLASLMYSQSADTAMEEVKLSDVTITPPINADYMNEVSGGTNSIRVFTLEKEASRYNLKESPFYNERGLSKIQFSQKNGRIKATYNVNGKIVRASERYEDLKLPVAVRNAAYKQNPDWSMQGNVYLVSYHHKNGTTKVYKIHFKKGSQKKNLTFDSDGNQI